MWYSVFIEVITVDSETKSQCYILNWGESQKRRNKNDLILYRKNNKKSALYSDSNWL